MRNATNVVLAVVLLTSPAAAEHASVARIEVLRAPGHGEVLLGAGMGLLNIEVEFGRLDFIDFSGGTSFDLRGGFLGWGYRIERPRWGAFVGAHVFTLWNDAIRYVTPWAGLRVGEETRTSIELRSAGIFAASVDEQRGRELGRDFDIMARVSTPVGFARLEARARYRDIDKGALHVRDVFVGGGFELAVTHGTWRGVPTFVGVGWRHERWRDEPMDAIERVVERPSQPRWQALLWLEVDIGVVGPERD